MNLEFIKKSLLHAEPLLYAAAMGFAGTSLVKTAHHVLHADYYLDYGLGCFVAMILCGIVGDIISFKTSKSV